MHSVELVFGRTGTGKSRRIAEKIKEISINDADSEFYIIVPDQFTLTSQNYYLDQIPPKVFSRVKVCSFNFFYRYVFNMVGKGFNSLKFITDSGKTALMTKSFKLASPELRFFTRDHLSIGIINRLMNVFSEFKRNKIDAKELEKIAVLESDDKLWDMSKILYNYEILTSTLLADSNDNSSKLCELLDFNDIFDGTYFFFDNFIKFTQSEIDVIISLCKQNSKISISFPIDFDDKSYMLFDNIKRSANKLMGNLNKNGIGFDIVKLDENVRFTSNDLEDLERLFLRNGEVSSISDPVFCIHIYHGLNLEDELEAVACYINEKVSEGEKFSDFVITARNTEKYVPYMRSVFDEYNIPYFYHKRTPLMNKPLLILISSLFDMSLNGYSEKNVINMIKTGFLDITREDEYLFYLYLKSIFVNNEIFKAGFKIKTNVIADNGKELDKINDIRRKVIEITSPFVNVSKENTIEVLSKTLYDFFKKIDLENKLEDLASKYLDNNENVLYEETLQIYDLLVSTIDELCMIMGDDKVSIEEYKDLIFSSFKDGAIGVIPTSTNEVLVGDAEKIPFLSPKYTFILGMSDGAFPREKGIDPIIGEKEVGLLNKYDHDYGMPIEQFVIEERYLAYTVMTSPSRTLWLSYSNSSGPARSPFINEVERIFCDINTEESPYLASSPRPYERIRTEQSLINVYGKTKDETLKKIIEDYFKQDKKKKAEDKLEPETAQRLYGNNRNVSYSQTDVFYKCKFMYFLKYGLGLNDSDYYHFQTLETGTFLHEGLEYFVPRYKEIGHDYDSIMNRSKDFLASYLKNHYSDTNIDYSLKAFYYLLLRRLTRVVGFIYAELDADGFKPKYVELKFSEDTKFKPLSVNTENGDVSVKGIIDRVDTYETDEKIYVKIIDYKSGGKTIDFNNIYNGIDMQLFLYMDALLNNNIEISSEKKVVPGCLMYVKINPEIIRIGRSLNDNDIKSISTKQIIKSGLEISSDDKVHALLKAEEVSHGYTTNTKLESISEDDLKAVFSFVEKKIKEMENSLLKGDIEKAPTSSKFILCNYCLYRDYCSARMDSEENKEKRTINDIKKEMEADINVD